LEFLYTLEIMMLSLKSCIIPFIAFILGILIGWIILRLFDKKRLLSAKKTAEMIIDKAKKEIETLKKERLLEVKEKWYKKIANEEKEIENRKKELRHLEKEYNKRINSIDKRVENLDRKEGSLINWENKLRIMEEKNESIKKHFAHLIEQENVKLQEIADLTKEEAVDRLLKNMEAYSRREGAIIRKKIIDNAKNSGLKEAANIIATAIQRTAVDQATESTVSVICIPTEEMKGRIIGREGRNIRTFERETGVELIVDDTPEAVILSSFDPIRREIAKLSLERLIEDGRIHPGRIEEIVDKTRRGFGEVIKQVGENACLELDIHNISNAVIQIIGKLKYRTSYGQNVLNHSKETAWLCGIIAAELSLDQNLAKRIGLLHDIGKAVSYEENGSHAEIGANIARRNGESEIVINAIAAHHGEVEPISPYAVIVQSADAISGARPGARRETLESYIKRLEKLEHIAQTFAGVNKSYAIQAGRELRIIVEHKAISDAEAELLASDIARRIENEVQYPGEIKVTVIREIRRTAIAK